MTHEVPSSKPKRTPKVVKTEEKVEVGRQPLPIYCHRCGAVMMAACSPKRKSREGDPLAEKAKPQDAVNSHFTYYYCTASGCQGSRKEPRPTQLVKTEILEDGTRNVTCVRDWQKPVG